MMVSKHDDMVQVPGMMVLVHGVLALVHGILALLDHVLVLLHDTLVLVHGMLDYDWYDILVLVYDMPALVLLHKEEHRIAEDWGDGKKVSSKAYS